MFFQLTCKNIEYFTKPKPSSSSPSSSASSAPTPSTSAAVIKQGDKDADAKQSGKASTKKSANAVKLTADQQTMLEGGAVVCLVFFLEFALCLFYSFIFACYIIHLVGIRYVSVGTRVCVFLWLFVLICS